MFSFLKTRWFVIGLGLLLLGLFIWYAGPYFAFADYRPLETPTARLIVNAAVVAAVVAAGWLRGQLAAAFRRRRRIRRASQIPKTSTSASNPYVGPRPFERADRDRFFGREREATHLLNKIYSHSVVLLYAQSGCGKTSILNARVLDELERDGINVLPIARVKRAWSPGMSPDEVDNVYTFNILLGWCDEAAEDVKTLKTLTLLKGLHNRFPTVDGEQPCVLVIDQFEEVFTAYPDRWQDRYPFFEQIGALLAAHRTLRVVLTMREDYLALLDRYVSLVVDGQWSRVRLEPLRQTEAIEAVVGPLTSSGRSFAKGVAEELVADLAQIQSRTESGATGTVAGEFVEPVQLQVVCSSLWEHLPPDRAVIERNDLEGFGDVDLALATFYEKALERATLETDADEKAIREWVQEHLITSAGTRGMVMEGEDKGLPTGVLAALEAARLIRAEWRHGARWFELTHDRFIAPIRASNLAVTRSQLAQFSRGLEALRVAAAVGKYAAALVLALGAFILLPVSYGRNRAYLDAVAADVRRLHDVPHVAANASLDAALPRLDALRAVVDSANRYGAGEPWSMRWGLYQPNSVRDAAWDAYARELDGAMLTYVAARFRQRLIDYASEPERLYAYLKGYLMLGNPEHLDKQQLSFMADLEFQSAYANDPARAAAISKHFRSLLEYEDSLRPVPIDDTIVTQARSSLQQISQGGLVYRYVRITYADDSRAVRLDQLAGLGAERAFRRKSKLALTEPIASIYTKPVFLEITSDRGASDFIKQFTGEYWVWGNPRPAITASSKLTAEFLDIYEKDYIAQWDRILNDIEPAPMGSLDQTKTVLEILSAPTSPLKALLKVVDDNTYLVTPPQVGNGGVLPRIGNNVTSIFEAGRERLGITTSTPGVQITAHFAPVHALFAGTLGSTPIDRITDKLNELWQKMAPLGVVGGLDPNDPQVSLGIRITANELTRDAATLPPFPRSLIFEIANLVRRRVPSFSN